MSQNLDAYLASRNTLESLAEYDFKNESPWQDVNIEKNPLKKFQLYKSKTTPNFDCDRCELTSDIFHCLWGWSYTDRFHLPEKLAPHFEPQWERLGSDTMNSFATIYRTAQAIYVGSDAAVSKNHLLAQFASLTHTIGNFVLVPFQLDPKHDTGSFNQCRGYRGKSISNYFVYDFFDLSLKLIQEHTDKRIFRKYIDTFFLNDYVDEAYNIIPLLKSHDPFLKEEMLDVEGPEKFLPQDEKELNEYLDNVLRLIKARGQRIVAALRSQNIGTESCGQIKRKKSKQASGIKRFLISSGITFGVIIILLYAFLTFETLKNSAGLSNLIKEYGLRTILSDFLRLFCNSFKDVTITAFVLLLIVTMIFMHVKLLINNLARRCKNCKKYFAIQKASTVVIGKEKISVLMKLEDRYEDGSYKGSHEQYIPGTRTTYKVIYRCKYCGHENFRTRTEKHADL